MEEHEKKHQVKQLYQFSRQVRGHFLEGAAWIEVLPSDILSQYFCSSTRRRNLFFSEVANTMSLRAKTELLAKVIKHEFPALEAEFPGLKNRLDKFREFRNTIAHCHLDTSAAQISAKRDDEVTYVVYKLGASKPMRVTMNDVQRQQTEANRLRGQLESIQERLVAVAKGGGLAGDGHSASLK